MVKNLMKRYPRIRKTHAYFSSQFLDEKGASSTRVITVTLTGSANDCGTFGDGHYSARSLGIKFVLAARLKVERPL